MARWIRRFRGLAAPVALAALAALAAVSCTSGGTVRPSATPTSAIPTVNPAAESPGTGPRSAASGGVLFGGTVSLTTEQSALGRKLAIVRDYYRIGQSFPSAADKKVMQDGSTLLVSLDTVPPKGPSYASIAAGHEDATILRFLTAMNQAATTYKLGAIYICFEHEADNPRHHRRLGSPAEFIKAWDHLHQLAASAHLDWTAGGRLHWVWILTSLGFRKGVANAFWPGSDQVDIVGADGYNTGTCRKAPAGTDVVDPGRKVKTPQSIFGKVIGFAATHGRVPVFIAEWGSIPYTSASLQPDFIHMMQSFVTANREIAAVLYWNGHGQGNGCDYILNGNKTALSALASMARSATLQGHPSA